jgi:hypothetical protein
VYRLLPIAALALLTGACTNLLVSEPVPHEARGLVLSIEATPHETSPGDTVRIVARLTNTNPHAVTLNFGSACQIMPYVEDSAGRIVEPQGGAWACAGVMTSIRLEARAAEQRVFVWTGEKLRYEPPAWLPVRDPQPAGAYQVHATLSNAELDGRLVSLRTPAQAITLRGRTLAGTRLHLEVDPPPGQECHDPEPETDIGEGKER